MCYSEVVLVPKMVQLPSVELTESNLALPYINQPNVCRILKNSTAGLTNFNVVHLWAHKSHIKKEFDGLHNHASLITTFSINHDTANYLLAPDILLLLSFRHCNSHDYSTTISVTVKENKRTSRQPFFIL